MIEEAILGDADCGDQLLDRGGGEAFLQDGDLGRCQEPLPCITTPAGFLLHRQAPSPIPRLYHECTCRRTSSPRGVPRAARWAAKLLNPDGSGSSPTAPQVCWNI